MQGGEGVTPGYYLGFRALVDEMRDLRRPSDIPVTDGFLKTLYIDFHFMNQEFNGQFFTDAVDSSSYEEPIENDLYGITLGFGLGDNLTFRFVYLFRFHVLKLASLMILEFLPESSCFPITESTIMSHGESILHTSSLRVIFQFLMNLSPAFLLKRWQNQALLMV